MTTIDPARALLLVIAFQARLMPAIHEGEAAVRNSRRGNDAILSARRRDAAGPQGALHKSAQTWPDPSKATPRLALTWALSAQASVLTRCPLDQRQARSTF